MSLWPHPAASGPSSSLPRYHGQGGGVLTLGGIGLRADLGRGSGQ